MGFTGRTEELGEWIFRELFREQPQAEKNKVPRGRSGWADRLQGWNQKSTQSYQGSEQLKLDPDQPTTEKFGKYYIRAY